MSGGAQRDSISESPYTTWEVALRPFHGFLVQQDLHHVPLDNEEIARRLAKELRRTMLRILTDCEIDQERDDLLTAAGSMLRKQPIWTLRTRESAVVDLISTLWRYFDAETCHATPPFSFGDVIRSIDQFLRPSEVTPLTPKNVTPPTTATESPTRPTPMKFGTKGLISEPETQHSVMDPQLAAELKRSLWYTLDDTFFDTFFPPVDDVPPPSTFPALPTEDAVVTWFGQYYETFCTFDAARRRRDDTWAWQISPTRPLYHPDNMKRKLDLFITSKSAQSNNPIEHDTDDTKVLARVRDRWKDVVVVGELKYQQNVGDLNPKIVIQLANYARETFGTQPGRRFVHTFTIINQKMRCWIFTRSGGVSSRSVGLNTPAGLNIFRRVFVGYMRMNRHQLGLANFAEKVPLGNQMFYLSPEPLWPARGIVSRGTTCWLVEHLDEPTSEGSEPFVVKDSWRFSQRENEAILLRDCKDVGVEGVAEYIAHEESFDLKQSSESETVHQILGSALLQAAIPFDLEWKSKKRGSPYASMSSSAKRRKTTFDSAVIANSTRQMAIVSNPLRRSNRLQSNSTHEVVNRSRRPSAHSGVRAPLSPEPRKFPCLIETPASVPEDEDVDEDEPDAEAIAVARASGTCIPDRIHTRVVMSRGIRIDECTNYLEILLGIRDAVRGHRSLVTKGGILHRDISQNNIMIPHGAAPRADHYCGFLIDLDHAQRISGSPSGAPERTGTYPFLSIEALEGFDGFVHTFYDDLQSFWFVFLLLCTREEDIDEWCGSTKSASSVKLALATDEISFKNFLDLFLDNNMPDTNHLLALKTAATKARSALWPLKTRFDRRLLNDPAVRDEMYDRFVEAFDKAIFMIDPSFALFKKKWEERAETEAEAQMKSL